MNKKFQIDFSPPPRHEQEEILISQILTPSLKEIGLRFVGSKLIMISLIVSLSSIILVGNYIKSKYDTSHISRTYSDVEFMNNETLSKNYELVFESDTAKAIYTIEYQEKAISNLKKIVALSDNDKETFFQALPVEVDNSVISLKEMGNDWSAILITSESVSSIQKMPMVVNYALYFKDNKLQKIQAFLFTSDDFIVQDKLNNSKFAKWDKKTIIAIDKKIAIFEAVLGEDPIPAKAVATEETEEVLPMIRSNIPEDQIIPEKTEYELEQEEVANLEEEGVTIDNIDLEDSDEDVAEDVIEEIVS